MPHQRVRSTSHQETPSPSPHSPSPRPKVPHDRGYPWSARTTTTSRHQRQSSQNIGVLPNHKNHVAPSACKTLYAALANAFSGATRNHVPTPLEKEGLTYDAHVDLQEYCNGVVHPVTKETITNYKKLANDPLLRETWTKAMCKELGNIAQGFGDTKGTNTVRFLTHAEIAAIPKDRTVTYARIVVDYRPQKEDPNRVRITVGGNLISYPGELTTRTADLTTTKLLWNSVISTKGAGYKAADVKSFYLETPLDRFEYMRMHIDLIPPEFADAYNLHDKVKDGYVYMEIRKGMYGLPQAGILANKLLKERLAPKGYYEVEHTPGLWKHIWRSITFTLVVDDFGIKYEGEEHFDDLITALREHYTVEVDDTGGLYCGITLQWNYEKGYVDISMPGYVTKQLTRYGHTSKRKTFTPYDPGPIRFGKAAQDLPPPTRATPSTTRAKGEYSRSWGAFYITRAPSTLQF